VTLSRRQLTAGLAWLAGIGVLAAAVAARGSSEDAFLVPALVAGAVAAAYVAVQTEPAWLLSAGIALSVFSGNTAQLGLPIGPERLLVAGGLLAVVLRAEVRPHHNGHGAQGLPRLTFTHWVLLAASAWAVVSALSVGTLTQSAGLFGLLDRFGLVGFAAYYAAPVVFRTRRQRSLLLGCLVVVGGYLGLTAVFEYTGLRALVFPGYINDPGVGIHFGRARGPFVEAVADGMGMFIGATAAAVGLSQWREWRVRLACWAVIGVCGAGMLLTLTRSIWLSGAVGAVLGMLAMPGLRRWVAPAVAVGAVLVVAALFAAPGLHQRVESRSQDDASVWVRQNTNRAALAMIEQRPVTGFGWQRFRTESPPYFTQAQRYPMNGVGEGVHNVFLSHASELGLPGAFLWLCGFVLAIGGAIVRRVGAELTPWRAGLVAIAAQWLVVANLTPLPWSFPTLVLWTWAGIVAGAAAARRRPQPAGAHEPGVRSATP
jgi:putative inorganic carbon (hco3(-)) transporter